MELLFPAAAVCPILPSSSLGAPLLTLAPPPSERMDKGLGVPTAEGVALRNELVGWWWWGLKCDTNRMWHLLGEKCC